MIRGQTNSRSANLRTHQFRGDIHSNGDGKLELHNRPECNFKAVYSPRIDLSANRPQLYHFHTYAVQAAFLCDSTNIFYRRKAAVVSQKVAEVLRFDSGLCGIFAVSCGSRTVA